MEINDFSEFIEEEKQSYIQDKIQKYQNQGFSLSQAINKANQSWRAYVGHRIQSVIKEFLYKALKEYDVKIISDKDLIKDNLPEELAMVKRLLVIDFGKYLFLPDADIILYKKVNNYIKILAIISVKNSFRERGFETTYWKLKLKQGNITSHIKVFLATPDKDDEIDYTAPNGKPKKMRVILEYELDGIYFLKENFERTPKVKHFSEIIADIKKLIY